MNNAVKHEFFRWISSLEQHVLSEIDRKVLNLLSKNFDTIIPLGTAGGKRVKVIGDLIQPNFINISPDITNLQIEELAHTEKVKSISDIKIGPLRGFTLSETFLFDKKYTFMYGPNGSGKSSFCEGLEYVLLDRIEEADAKRIALDEYIRNIKKNAAKKPRAFGLTSNNQRIPIHPNQTLYRFAFVEKRKIELTGLLG